MYRRSRQEIFEACCQSVGKRLFKDLMERAFGWEGIGGQPADEVVERLASQRKITLLDVLEQLTIGQLREVCEILDAPVRSRERQPFLDQILLLNHAEAGSAGSPEHSKQSVDESKKKEPTMARTPKSGSTDTPLGTYAHKGETRKNNPTALLAGQAKVPKAERVKYAYDPHLPPVLRFDSTGSEDKLPELIAKATRGPLSEDEAKLLADAIKHREPWLEWAGKREAHQKGHFSVDPVALHIHERVSAEAIVRAAKREDVQRDLFADPELPFRDEIKFYQHDVAWANRLILGDSLQVMTSLSRREDLVGKVQMIYFDPPYGIKFGSNFQPEIKKRNIKESDLDLARDPEMVRAFRDTWTLGIHTYLAYIKERLLAAKDLLTNEGSIFVQISEENCHKIQGVLDEVFTPENMCSKIVFLKTTGKASGLLDCTNDYVLWYCKDRAKVKYRQLFEARTIADDYNLRWAALSTGERVRFSSPEDFEILPEPKSAYRPNPLTSQTPSETTSFEYSFEGGRFNPGKSGWKTNVRGMNALAKAERLQAQGNTLGYVRYLNDFNCKPRNNVWEDTRQSGFADEKIYVVQTGNRVIERCMLMTTDPGDLVLDPTCGSGTTATVAETWGRRWITIDTSRVALSLARQRLLTNRYPWHKLRPLTEADRRRNPKGQWLRLEGMGEAKTLHCKTVPHITLKSIARNESLDPIFARHEPILAEKLAALNAALKGVSADLRVKLKLKLSTKEKTEGKRAVTDADRRRWDLPVLEWKEWEVPFDTDPDWPQALQEALTAYRKAWRAKMDEVNACIDRNAEQEELVDQPEIDNKVLRVCGPFTVEGVRPEELSLGEDGLFDPTPDEWEVREDANTTAYFDNMLENLRQDGVTFLGNKNRKLTEIAALYRDNPGSLVHAEAAWADSGSDEPTVAIVFGPQYGPVTSEMLQAILREVRRYKVLVIAGFSFDAEASGIITDGNLGIEVLQAHIRPDLNAGMQGLLKNTAGSQLFTVFGQPEISVDKTKDGYEVKLDGVDIYDPLNGGVVHSTNCDKVAAWFLDTDFDGKCFCTCQAFFPDQDAWEKIIKALKSNADLEAFARFKGTTSLPFQAGKHRRVAVKVIDPRGNEVMAIKKLEG